MSLEIITPQAIEIAHNADAERMALIGEYYIELGISLVEREKQGLWDKENFPSFASYCAAPQRSGGLGLPERSRQACMQIARKYHYELGVSEERLVKVAKENRSALTMLAPVVTPENIEDVLADAESLSCSDIKENKAEGRYGNTPQTSAGRPESVIICPNCKHEIKG